ncbi:MAG: hypothetical protein ABSC45_10785 [Desulfobaccales bacterium]
MKFQIIDKQMSNFSGKLKTEVGLRDDEIAKVATLVAAEVRFLNPSTKAKIVAASPVPIANRVDELKAFQAWMDFASTVISNPAITRAQVIVQNYVCFVYLSEACFLALRKGTPPGSLTRRCSQFLTDNPIRAFRNAIAHSNWTYRPDFHGLVFWAKKGSVPDEPLSRFEVNQEDLNFWQALSRAVAYSAYISLIDTNKL